MPAPAAPVRRFWPAGEAAQADYESLRAHVLATGAIPDSLAAARFDRRGVAGLIAWPAAEPVFAAALLGAARTLLGIGVAGVARRGYANRRPR